MGKEATGETTDADLVARALAGQPPAFAYLVRRHAPIAKRMAVLWGAGADADDVVQNAFIKGVLGAAALPSIEGLSSVVAEHRAQRDAQPAPRRGRRAARESLAGPSAELWILDPEEEALSTDRRDRLLASVRRLPIELRDVVSCRYLLELSEAETAVALKLPPGTVKSRLHRALASLRQTEVSHE